MKVKAPRKLLSHLEKEEESIVLLLDAITAPTMPMISVHVTISSSFLKILIEGIVCASSSRGHLCPEMHTIAKLAK